jgi:YD repeat-containing protein
MGLSGWVDGRGSALVRGRRAWPVGWVLAVVVGLLLVCAGSAGAEGLCSDSWVGGVSGSWGLASNWSGGHVPAASDIACIGSGKTVAISEGANHAGVLRDEGSLSLTGGSLELSDVFEASNVVTLLIENATLTGAATLDVSHSLAWISGTMSGSGETVITAAATVSLLSEGGCELAHLTARRLVNDGTVTFGNDAYSTGGSLVMAEGARVENAGTFYDNSDAGFCSPENGTIVEGSAPAPLFVNTGTFTDTEADAGFGAEVDVPFENRGTFDAAVGYLGWGAAVPVTLASASTLEGKIYITQADVTAESMLGAGASVQLEGDGTLSIAKGATVSLNSLRFVQAFVTGAGSLNIVSFLEWEKDAEMSGSGQTTLEGGATAEIATHGAGFCEDVTLRERTFTNDGTVYLAAEAGLVGESTMLMADGARLENNGVFNDNSGASFCPGEISIVEGAGKASRIVNTGRIARQGYKGGFVADIGVYTENWGALTGVIGLLKPFGSRRSSYGCSEDNPSFPKREVAELGGVCTGTGDLSETQTDFSIGGHGSGLELSRTYNSAAAQEKEKSIFGYGWSGSYSTEHLYYETVEEPEEPATHEVRIVQENGSCVEFIEAAGGMWTSPEGSPDILTGSTAAGFTLTLEDQFVYKFSGSTGNLESVKDENNNTTSFTYNGSGQIEKVTDQSGESLTFAYNSEGLVKTVTDPMKHVVEYGYSEGALVSVTQPGESALRWQFKYEGNAQLAEIIDGRGEKTTYEYSAGHQVIAKTDAMSRTTKYEYGSTFTKVTNQATGAVTDEYLTTSGQPVEIIHGVGTAHASSEAFTYNTAGNKLTHTNGDGQVWRYEYSSAGDETVEEDPEGHKTKREYNIKHQVTEETLPDGESTKYERDSHGNILAEEREAPENRRRRSPTNTTNTVIWKARRTLSNRPGATNTIQLGSAPKKSTR